MTVEGRVFRTDDLTLAEAAEIEKATDTSWLRLNPFGSANHCLAILTAFLARDRGQEEAAKIISAMPVGDALDCLELVEDDKPTSYTDGLPKAEGAPETSGSSGAPSDSDGLQT